MSQPENEKVTKNNDRLFSIYEAHLKKPNIKDYADTAAKLAAWLSDPKAYYTAARPKIIKLLITAQITLRSAVGYTLDINVPFMPARCIDHPLTVSYVRLVHAIAPFHGLFVESHLKDTVTHLLRSVEGISLPPLSISPPFISTSRQSPSLTSPPVQSPLSYNYREQTTAKETRSQTGSGASQPESANVSTSDKSVGPTAQTINVSATGIQQPAVEETLYGSVSKPDPAQSAAVEVRRSPSPEIIFVGMSKKREAGLNSNSSIALTRNNLESAGTSKQTGRVRPKKTKKIDLSAFVQSDIQDFKQKQAEARRQALNSISSIKKETEIEQTSLTANAGQPGDNAGAMPISHSSVGPPPVQIPEQRSLPMSPAQGPSVHRYALPAPQPLVPSGRTEQPVDNKYTPAVLPSHPDRSQGPGQLDPSHQGRKVSPTFISPPPPSVHLSSLQTPFVPCSGSKSNGQVQIGPSAIDLVPPRAQHDTQLPTETQPTALHPLKSAMPAGRPFNYSLQLTSAPAAAPPAGDSSAGPSTTVPPHAIPDATQPVASIGAKQSQTIRPLIISESSSLARFFKLYEECKSAQPSDEDNPGNNVETEIDREQPGIHDGSSLADDMAALDLAAQASEKMFHVVAFAQGRIQDTCTEITFDMAQPDMDPLSKWLNRSTLRLRDLMSSCCLSLGCYSSQELMKFLGNRLDATTDARLTKAITSLSSVWPQEGGLTMNVHIDGSRKDLPLAPPFVITGDGFVDVSEFVVLGRNSIMIHQQEKDFLDYTFVLHAHNPTLEQLQDVVGQRKKELEWKDWLVGVTRPLEFNMPPLFPTPA